MRWVAFGLTLLLWGLTWPQVLPRDADLPPCHMMLLIGLTGVWTLVEFVRARIARQRALAGKRWSFESRRARARKARVCLICLVAIVAGSAFTPLTVHWERERLSVVDGSVRLAYSAFGCDWGDFAALPRFSIRFEPFWKRTDQWLSWYWLPVKGGGPFNNGRIAYVPFYPLLPLAGVVAWALRAPKHSPPFCRKCGYDLTGNVSGSCPECGDSR